jgi:hypothetical protein
MQEEAKLQFTITVRWQREDGRITTTQLDILDRGACRSPEDVGLRLEDGKQILGRLQQIVVGEQLQRQLWFPLFISDRSSFQIYAGRHFVGW